MSAALEVTGLAKTYPDRREHVVAVDGVGFTVEAGDFYTLLGPSGCGKTSTMRCVAGLDYPDAGTIAVDGVVVSDAGSRRFVPPERRSIGMVFQSYAIWPHLTVFENVAFPLRVGSAKVREPEIKRRVEEMLAAVYLAGYESRPATNLSGGQQQRLALARALMREPKLLLLDEPLSNLDAKLREQMRGELRQLQRRFGITTLYVTHDQAEALSMSNRIAVLSQGKIVQEGTPREIYHAPATRFVADFVGASNLIEARVVGAGECGRTRFETSAGPLEAVAAGLAAGAAVAVSVRPEDVRIHRTPHAAVNVLPATVGRVLFLGDYLQCRLDVGAGVVFAREHPSGAVREGDAVYVELPPDACSVLAELG